MCKNNKYVININGNAITEDGVTQCIKAFKNMLNDNLINPELEIVAKNEITNIDFSLIGHLILIKKTIPNIKIRIILLKNRIEKYDKKKNKNNNTNSILWKLIQLMAHSFYTSNESIYSVIDANGEIKEAESRFDSWFVLSKKFLPTIFINEKNYSDVFIKPINFIPIHNVKISKRAQNYEEYLYQSCRTLLFSKLDKGNYIHILSQLSFFRALQAAKILRYYLYDELNGESRVNLDITSKGSIAIGNISDERITQEYRNFLEPIFNELKQKPPIYHLLFYTLISSDLIPNKFLKSKIQNEAEKIKYLWDFTKELIYGVNELVKNILQHATTKQGVITGYINDRNELVLNIFDHGKERIIDRFIETTEKIYQELENSSPLKDIFKKDLKIIKKANFDFTHFFEHGENPLLNQQTKRSTAHLGLLLFSKLIKYNNGKLFVSSNNFITNETDKYNSSQIKQKYIPIGTNYQLYLPIKKEINYQPYKKITTPNIQSVQDTINIKKLLKYRDVTLKTSNDLLEFSDIEYYQINLMLQNNDKENEEFEKELWYNLYNLIVKNYDRYLKNNNTVICLDFNQLENKINGSQLFRLLGKWEIEFPRVNLIIYNIRVELLMELTEINDSYTTLNNSELAYWNPNLIILIYSYKTNIINEDDKFYFTDALWGQSKDDFIYINTLIKKNNYNSFLIQNNPQIKTTNNILINNIFFNKSTLLPFDLIIKNSKNVSIFENNSKILLNNELKEVKQNTKSIVTKDKFAVLKENLPGFKISDSHFRIGSKIHISDFYYAKRFYQNSFYSSRFAFLLTKYLIEKRIIEEIDEVTLVGYGIYSELLLSLIVKFLKEYYNKKSINHNLINDSEDFNLVKGDSNLKRNIVIIIPIATTFSTSIKVEKKLLKCESVKKILTPHINAIIVANGDIENKSDIKEYDIEKGYGWIKVIPENKEVTISTFFDRNTRIQKYFISLVSTWYEIENCNVCFPQKSLSSCFNKICNNCVDKEKVNKCPLCEKPLFLTDKTSVTPSLLFDTPRARVINDSDKRKFILTNSSIEYGHITRNNKHFHYHIYDELFYKDNEVNIINWLSEVKTNISDSSTINYSESDNVLIFAPEHFSNSIFINIVNEILFENSANIIHYDIWKSNFENFQTFHEEMVLNAKKIFFVDDSIITGSTFFRCNDFVKFLRHDKKYGFDACILLINRTNYLTQKNICRKIQTDKRFYSFANLHLPSLEEDGKGCQLCHDFKKAELLFYESYLDRFKHYFIQRIDKLKLVEVSTNTKQIIKKLKPFEDPDQNLKKIEAIHRIYDFFSSKERQLKFINNKNLKFLDWYKQLIDSTVSPLQTPLITSLNSEKLLPLESDTAILLKVLAFPPLSFYKPLKEKIFNWTNELLNEQIELIKQKKYDIKYEYEIRDLKYLVRRAGLLNSNFLISNRFLKFICELYNSNCLDLIREKAVKKETELKKLKENEKHLEDITKQRTLAVEEIEDKIEYFNTIKNNIDGLGTYIVAQIKELVYENNSKSIVLEMRINKVKQQSKDNIRLRQIFRMLQEENGILINRFWEFSKKQFIKDGILNISNDSDINLKTSMDDFIIQSHYEYNSLCKFLKAANENSPIMNFELNKYLQIETFLAIDSHREENRLNNIFKNYSLKSKTKILGDNLRLLVFGENSHNDSGSFLLVKYRSSDKADKNADNLFLAYNTGYRKDEIESKWADEANYITNFVDGTHDIYGNVLITIDELMKKEDNNWYSLYTKPKTGIKIDFISNIIDIKYILIVRLSLKNIDSNSKLDPKSQGAIIFYSNKPFLGINKTRYLLLLKQSIGLFISRHHKNDEFRDWYESDKLYKELESLKNKADSERREKEELLNLYNERFDKFYHGAQIYLDELQDQINSGNYNYNLFLTFLVRSHINIGIYYQEFLQEDKIKTNAYLETREMSFSETFKIAIQQINLRNSNHKIHISLSDSLRSKIPVTYLQFIIFECISNAIYHAHNRDIDIFINYDSNENIIIIKSVGRTIDSKFNLALFLEHLRSKRPNLKYGIGLFVCNKIIYNSIERNLGIDINENSLTFIIRIPLS